MRKRALITGLSGQDGSNLADLLIAKGYEVWGIVRRQSVAEAQSIRYKRLEQHGMVTTIYGDVTDYGSLVHAITTCRPHLLFNLAAMSHVRVSFDVPHYTWQVNAVGALNVLEALRRHSPETRFYQASSSEMFGTSVDDDGYQRLTTPFNPTSPYGIAKLAAYHATRHYRRAYKMFAVNGILFNHTGPRRGSAFVEMKIVKAAVQIHLGRADELRLGNMDAKRDWGDSRDYVRAMLLMLEHDKPDDWLVATGETRSVREVCEHVFAHFGFGYRDWVRQDERYMRPEDVQYLRGDASKIRECLGWRPEYTFQRTIAEMIAYWQEELNGGGKVAD